MGVRDGPMSPLERASARLDLAEFYITNGLFLKAEVSATVAKSEAGKYLEEHPDSTHALSIQTRAMEYLTVARENNRRPLSAPAGVNVTRQEIMKDRIVARMIMAGVFEKARDDSKASRSLTARIVTFKEPSQKRRILTAPIRGVTTGQSPKGSPLSAAMRVKSAWSRLPGAAMLSRSAPTLLRSASRERKKQAKKQRAREELNLARKEARAAKRREIMSDFEICIKSLRESSRKYMIEKGMKSNDELYEERIFHSGELRNLPRAQSQDSRRRPSTAQWHSDLKSLKEDLLNSQWKIMKKNPESSPTEIRLSVTRPPEDDIPVDMDKFGMVSCKMDEFFQEWLSTPQAARLVKRLVALANNDSATLANLASSPHNTPGATGTAIPAATRSPSAGLGLSPSHSPGGGNVSWEEELLSAPPPYFTLKDASPPATAVVTPKSPGRRTSDADQSPTPPVEKQKVTSPSNRQTAAKSPVLTQSAAASSESGATPKKAMMTSIEGAPSIIGRGADIIPRFYIPVKSRRVTDPLTPREKEVINQLFQELGGPIDAMDEDCFAIWQTFCSEQLCISMYFADPALRRIRSFNGADESAAVTKDMFMKYYRGIGLELGKPYENFFNVVRKDTCDYIVKNDFREFVWVLLDSHPGLEFLQDTPEFQDRYTDTVLCRIFYCCDSKQLGRITLRDIKKCRPSLVETWLELDQCEDINKIRAFFSYEHFYVLYCKFWELDEDHDFLLDKDDLLKYDGHAFSRKAIDRIFSGIPAKFTSGIPGKMGYEDFCWFLISDEDKTTDTSLEYFFKLVDLDGDGVIRDHEMAYFYLEQVQRLECLHQEAVQFQDILCQMNDLIMPENEGQFELEDFKRTRKISGIFFSILLSLNKFLAYEQRDPFSIKQEQLEHPDYSDWDRYCAQEYIRLAMEDDADDQGSNSVMNADGTDVDGQQRLRNADGLDLGRG